VKKLLPELLRLGVRSIVTWAIVGAVVFMVIKELPAPDWFVALASMALGYWFRGQNGEHKES